MKLDTHENGSADHSAEPTSDRESPPDSADDTELEDRRRAVRRDHLESALRRIDPTLANLGVIHNDLLEMANKIKSAISNRLGTEELLESEVLPSAIGAYLKVAKQVAQITAIEMKLAAAPALEPVFPDVHSPRLRRVPGRLANSEPPEHGWLFNASASRPSSGAPMRRPSVGF